MIGKRSVFLILLAGLPSALPVPAQEHLWWGTSGYLLDLQRVRPGHEDALNGQQDGDPVPEIERWRSEQIAYLGLGYRYGNLIELQADLSVSTDISAVEPSLQQLYLTILPSDWISLVFGRQRLKWGAAKVFAAIDKLEAVVDPFGSRVLREGIDGFKMVVIPTEWMGFSLVILPTETLRWTQAAVRLDLLVLDTDIGLGLIKYNSLHVQQMSLKEEAGDVVNETIREAYDRLALFVDMIRYFGNVGLYGELELRFSRENEYAFVDETLVLADVLAGTPYRYPLEGSAEPLPVLRSSAGLHWQLQTRPYLNLLLEYFYNGEGFTGREARDFWEGYLYHSTNAAELPMLLPAGFGRFGSFRRHYLCLGFTEIRLADDLAVGVTATANLESLAVRFSPEIDLTINQNVSIHLGYEFLQAFTDPDENPGDFNFLDYNHCFTLSVTAGF